MVANRDASRRGLDFLVICDERHRTKTARGCDLGTTRAVHNPEVATHGHGEGESAVHVSSFLPPALALTMRSFSVGARI